VKESRAARRRSGGLLVYMVLLVSLQSFLLVIALEGIVAHEPALARNAAVLSVVVLASAWGLRWFVRDDD